MPHLQHSCWRTGLGLDGEAGGGGTGGAVQGAWFPCSELRGAERGPADGETEAREGQGLPVGHLQGGQGAEPETPQLSVPCPREKHNHGWYQMTA